MLISDILLDVNECADGTDNCHQNCNNTVGSYVCYCDDGYQLDSGGIACIGN